MLSSGLRTLLAERVDSFEKLEVLMHLRRAPGQTSTHTTLASALERDRDDVRQVCADLRQAGLVVIDPAGKVTLSPMTASDEVLVKELADVYEADRIEVVKAIAESSLARIRNMAGRAFAEAFVLRKRDGRDGGDDGSGGNEGGSAP
jgi:DNA-binding GntR family transcriptional regulator